MAREQVIRIHAHAPPKPALGATCNGCGVCCLAEPCPVGVLVTLRRQGACRAVRWDEQAWRYRCGLVEAAGAGLPPGLRWLARPLGALARRLIASGQGCDSDARLD